MGRRPSVINDGKQLTAAIKKHCQHYSKEETEQVRASAWLVASMSLDSMDDIVARIVKADNELAEDTKMAETS